MENYMFGRLLSHVGHSIEVVTYGQEETVGVSIECEDCNEVLYSVEKHEMPPLERDYYRVAFRVLDKDCHYKNHDTKLIGEETPFELVALSELKPGDVFVMALVTNIGGREIIRHVSMENEPEWRFYLMMDDYPKSGPLTLPFTPLSGEFPMECWRTCEALWDDNSR